jgi:hypothetical protein
MFTAYVGTVVMVAIAATSDPPLPATAQRELLLRSPAYQQVFHDAYRRKVRQKRVWTSIAGTVVGTGITVAILVAQDGE